MVNHNALWTTIIILFAAGALVYGVLSYAGSPIFSSQEPPAAANSLAQGEVTVDVQLLSVENEQAQFSIALNTHSVDLSQFDLRELITLEYEGKILKPVSAPAVSGHHASGTVLFEMKEQKNNFLVRVRGIPPELDREFQFS